MGQTIRRPSSGSQTGCLTHLPSTMVPRSLSVFNKGCSFRKHSLISENHSVMSYPRITNLSCSPVLPLGTAVPMCQGLHTRRKVTVPLTPLTLRRSRGCVQQAAPHDASPPKYHRDIRFSVMLPGSACPVQIQRLLPSCQSDSTRCPAARVASWPAGNSCCISGGLEDTDNLVNLQTLR